VLWLAVYNNKIPHLARMSDEGRDFKMSVIVVWHVHCTLRTATHLMRKLQLGLIEIGERYGRFLITTDKCGSFGQNGMRTEATMHKSSDEIPLVYGNPSAGNKGR